MNFNLPVPVIDQSAVGFRGNFFVGGVYTKHAADETMSGQAYVEVLVPREVRRPHPLVLIHGAGQTSACWLQTPDGRMGWADFFVAQGYVVYLLDQPMRGRSAWHPTDGETRVLSVAQAENQITASAIAGAWPQAKLHTQWPGEGTGKGQKHDPVFDQFYASQVESVLSDEASASRVQAACSALLDKIGPAILLTHSQSGPFGWLVADARPSLVKAILAIEPSGPPFGAAHGLLGKGLDWGLTHIPMRYEPPMEGAPPFGFEEEPSSGPGKIACRIQSQPERVAVNLASVPVLVLTAEASYHAFFDHCTVKFLQQAGVKVDFVQLAEEGIHGNGHMMMLEKNNLDIARRIDEWVLQKVL
ncbi:alpha/beta hydrolase [Variovorax sp. RKNM96]|uniref:alpha/beta hydrolase n=1 Tax=Variovorax sp. RKNM96 TaxID=2681552 RepID=UPI001F123100|nr:alpha/beta hydrolase [Variovorax sp. RKNM96]